MLMEKFTKPFKILCFVFASLVFCDVAKGDAWTPKDSWKQIPKSELEVSLLNDDKKASMSFAGNKSQFFYSLKVEQKLDIANSNITFATREGLAGKTKLTLSSSYLFVDKPARNTGPAPQEGDDGVDGSDDINILKTFSLMNFSLSHFKNDVGYFSIAEDKRISANENGFEASLGNSYVTTASQRRYAYGLSYQRGYERDKSNKEKQICRDFDDSPNFSECFDAYLLPARKVEKFIPYFHVTWNFKENIVDSVQVAVKYIVTDESSSQEETKDNVVFEIPVHIWSFWDKRLSAGLKFAYSTRPPEGDDKFNAGVFLTVPLSIYQ